MINKALAERVAEDVDWLRAVGEARLMALLQAVWDKAQTGHIPSVRTALHIIEALMNLHGFTPHKSIQDPKADWPKLPGADDTGNPPTGLQVAGLRRPRDVRRLNGLLCPRAS